jgi:hypothetical protein
LNPKTLEALNNSVSKHRNFKNKHHLGNNNLGTTPKANINFDSLNKTEKQEHEVNQGPYYNNILIVEKVARQDKRSLWQARINPALLSEKKLRQIEDIDKSLNYDIEQVTPNRN